MHFTKFPPLKIRSTYMLLLLYFAFSMLAMYPSSLHLTRYKFGDTSLYSGSDSLGTISFNWSIANKATFNKSGELWTYFQGYPVGRKLLVHEPVRLIACFFTKLINPVFGYNIVIFFSFLLAGLFTHFLLFRLLNSHGISMFGGVTFMLSPFHILQAADHLNLAQTWIFPAFFILILKAIDNKNNRSLLYIALFMFFVLLIHGYYAVYLGFILFAVIVYLLINKTIVFQKKQLNFIIPAILISAILIIGVLYYMGMFSIVDGKLSFFKRPIDDLYTYGIHWYEFILPPYYSIFFKERVIDFIKTHHHGSNFIETTLFLGFIPLLLTGYFIYKLLRQSYAASPTEKKSRFAFAQVDKKHVAILLIIGLMPFFLGVAPEIDLFGFKVPTLSKLIFYMLPMLRTISRIGILTIFSITCFASFGLFFLVCNFPRYRKLIIFVLICGVCLEFTTAKESYYADTDIVPPVYKALKKIKGDVLVFEMPFKWGYMPDFWQTYHQKPLFNYFDERHPNFNKGLFLNRCQSLDEMLKTARKEKIDYLILHFDKKLPINRRFKNRLDKHIILPPGAFYSYLIKVN